MLFKSSLLYDVEIGQKEISPDFSPKKHMEQRLRLPGFLVKTQEDNHNSPYFFSKRVGSQMNWNRNFQVEWMKILWIFKNKTLVFQMKAS